MLPNPNKDLKQDTKYHTHILKKVPEDKDWDF